MATITFAGTQSTIGTSQPIDVLADQVDLDSPYNNALRIDHNNEPAVTSTTVSDLTVPPPFYHGFTPLSDPSTSNRPGEIIVDRSGQLMLKYITEKGVIDDLISSYDVFVTERMPRIIASRQVEVNKASGSFKFVFSRPVFELPAIPGERPGDQAIQILPRRARQEKRTYAASIKISVEQQDNKGNTLPGGGPIEVKLGEIPVMLGSVLDHLRRRGYKGNDLLKVGECKYDPFGYYIIRGDEKIIMTQNKLRANRILVYPDRDGDNIGIFTSQTILGHMPVQMYQDNDGTIRFHYYLLSSNKTGGKLAIRKGSKNKEKNTINILQVFRVLGRNAPEYSRDTNGNILTDDRDQPISVGRFDNLQDILIYILSFIDPNRQKKVLMALQASYVEAVNIGNDYVSIYQKSTLQDRYERRKKAARRSNKAEPIDPMSNMNETIREINDLTVEFIFTHISLHDITPRYIEQRARELLRSNPEISAGTDLTPFLTPTFLRQIELAERRAVINRKIMLLGIMTARFLEVTVGEREIDDRDAIGNQRFVTGGQMMEQLFSQMWNDNVKYLQKEMDKLSNPELSSMRTRMSKVSNDITNGFISAFNPNQWGAPGDNRAKQENITDRLDRGEAQVSVYSHLLRINAPTNRRMKSTSVRSIKQSQMGYIDPVETPSGGAVGLVNNRAVTCWISVDQSDGNVWAAMKDDVNPKKIVETGFTNVAMLDGDPKGWCNAAGLREKLLNARRSLTIPFDTTIVIDEGVLYVYTDGGRPTKPVLIVDGDLPLIAKRNMWKATFTELLRNGIVEYQDQWELKVHGHLAYSVQQLTFLREDLIRNRNLLTQMIGRLQQSIVSLNVNQAPSNVTSKEISDTINATINESLDANNSRQKAIAMWLSGQETFNSLFQKVSRTKLVIKRLEIKKYSHVDMDPTSILGINASLIPLIDRNPGPRNAFQCGMAKQALGLNYSNPAHRFPSTARYLSYPTRPVMATQMQRLLGLDDMPSGNNVVMAIMTMADNEEDAVVIKKEALERGLFTYTIYHSSTIMLKKEYTSVTPMRGVNVDVSDHLVKPIKPFPGHKETDYDSIDERGLAIPDIVVNPGDCLVGAVRVIKTTRQVIDNRLGMIGTRTETSIKYVDISLYAKVGEGGIIDKVLVARTGEGDLSITVRVSKTGQPIVGDKVATRQAQKSTIGRILPEAELPFTQRGLIPDVILNPHAIPKRMTMATLIEIMTSKYAALAGERVNGTVFRPFELDTFTELLQTLYGYNMYGNESMRSPITGETYPSQIMIGPAYYQLLKHQVSKKVQVRGGEGPRSIITGQAAKGKKRGGGTRFGEAEASGVLAHGAAHFIRERMYTSSDPYSGSFCRQCNRISTIDMVNEQATCSTCTSTDIGSCKVPRTWKGMTNYVSGLGIRTELFKDEQGKVPVHIRERKSPVSPRVFQQTLEARTRVVTPPTVPPTAGISFTQQLTSKTPPGGTFFMEPSTPGTPSGGTLFIEPSTPETAIIDTYDSNDTTGYPDDAEYDPSTDGGLFIEPEFSQFEELEYDDQDYYTDSDQDYGDDY